MYSLGREPTTCRLDGSEQRLLVRDVESRHAARVADPCPSPHHLPLAGALANGCFLLAVCFTISLEAIEKLFGLGDVGGEE